MGVGAAVIGAGALGTVGSIASGVIGANAATQAANTQATAAEQSTALQKQEFNTLQANYQPYLSAGASALTELQNLTGTNSGGNPLTAALTSEFNPTLASLAATPGYQFTLNQGLQATQNGFAAQGLAKSGAAIKGAANYAEGLAGTTYQQQFQNYWTQNQNIASLVGGQASLGENAAAQSGNTGVASITGIGNTITSGAAAQAAGTVGSANAITGALGGVTGSASNAALLYALNGNGLFGGTPGTASATAPATNSLYPGITAE